MNRGLLTVTLACESRQLAEAIIENLLWYGFWESRLIKEWPTHREGCR